MHHVVESQKPVFALLSDPATHAGCAVHRIDTHAAAVFLAGNRAFKVKRAVRFPFLDYSTLEKRKAACDAELAVNRPFAPMIYRRVVPITREADGRLKLEGTGEPIEWAVVMVRFDENATLDKLADRNRIDTALAETLGRVVAAAHAVAPIVEVEPWLAAIRSIIAQNNAAFRVTPKLFPAREVDTLSSFSHAIFARVHPLLVARGRLGLVRRGHGDLHLGNIALIKGQPVLFDAIEFDPLIAAGDVLYDLAFLIMDLVERGLKEAANIVLNRYLIATRRLEDLDAFAALPLFLSLRAAIRAKVTAARLEQAAEPDKPGIGDAARSYFQLACGIIQPPDPILIAIGGLSGTGKSLLAQRLAPAIMPIPGAVWLRSDIERKALFGLGEVERLPNTAYTPEITARVYGMLADKAHRLVAAGHSAVVDAVYADASERAAIASIARHCKVTFRGLFLVADLATRLARVEARMHDPSDADAAVARRQESYDLKDLDWTRIDAAGTPEQTLALAKTGLA